MGREIVNGEIEEVSSESLEYSNEANKLSFLSLNHVSYVCKSVEKSVQFYEKVLGFVLIKRPSSFDFEGAWYIYSSLSLSLAYAGFKHPHFQKEEKKIFNAFKNWSIVIWYTFNL